MKNWRWPGKLCQHMCVSLWVNLWSLSLGLRELCKAGLAEGCSVPHLQHTVPHHLCKHGGPQLVESLALQVGVWCSSYQLLEILLYHGGSLRRLHGALLRGKQQDRSRTITERKSKASKNKDYRVSSVKKLLMQEILSTNMWYTQYLFTAATFRVGWRPVLKFLSNVWWYGDKFLNKMWNNSGHQR